MKTHFTFLLLLLVSGTLQTFAKDGDPAPGAEALPPKENPVSAKDGAGAGSPTEPAPPPRSVEPSVDPFEGVSLAGYCGQGDTLTVYLRSGKDKKQLTVFGDGSPFKKRDTSGFRVIGINRGATLKTTWIILEKDGQHGTVAFEDNTRRTDSGTALPGGVQKDAVAEGTAVPRPATPGPSAAPNPQGPVYRGRPLTVPGYYQPRQPAPGWQPGTYGYSSNLIIPGWEANPQVIYPYTGPYCRAPYYSMPGFRSGFTGFGRGGCPPPTCRRVVFPCR